MKRALIVGGVVLLGVGVFAQGRGGPSPEQQAALAKQAELEKSSPRLQITEEVLNLVVPGHTIGEAVGVAKNSKGSLFVFTRSGNAGTVRGNTASQLFEFGPDLKFIKQWGPDNYAAGFAHTVRVDREDNVWMTDEGTNMIVKFNPQGQVAMVLGRKPESLDYLERFIEHGDHITDRTPPVGGVGTYNRPTDVAFDSQGNIYVADGYNNSRVVKVNRDGSWGKAVGTRGAGPDQFNTVHAIASDARNNIYVGDRGNRRIKVYDTDLNLKTMITNVGAPWSLCVSPGATQYLYSGDGNGKLYKLDLQGNLLGWAQTGLGHGQSGCLIHELHCESENVIYKGDCSTWTVEKITIKGTARPSN